MMYRHGWKRARGAALKRWRRNNTWTGRLYETMRQVYAEHVMAHAKVNMGALFAPKRPMRGTKWRAPVESHEGHVRAHLKALAPVIITMLLWDPVTRDRYGHLEPAPCTYLVPYFHAEVIGWQPDANGDPSPLYLRTSTEVPVAGTSWRIPDPPVGGLVAWDDPITVDAAGNPSNAP